MHTKPAQEKADGKPRLPFVVSRRWLSRAAGSHMPVSHSAGYPACRAGCRSAAPQWKRPPGAQAGRWSTRWGRKTPPTPRCQSPAAPAARGFRRAGAQAPGTPSAAASNSGQKPASARRARAVVVFLDDPGDALTGLRAHFLGPTVQITGYRRFRYRRFVCNRLDCDPPAAVHVFSPFPPARELFLPYYTPAGAVCHRFSQIPAKNCSCP